MCHWSGSRCNREKRVGDALESVVRVTGRAESLLSEMEKSKEGAGFRKEHEGLSFGPVNLRHLSAIQEGLGRGVRRKGYKCPAFCCCYKIPETNLKGGKLCFAS